MKKAEFYHRLKQVEYLEQVSHRFEALRLAFIKFNETWSEDSDFDLNLNDYLTTMYPFPKSFDEFLVDFALWYGDGASKIVKAKNEIQPRLSIKEINEMVEEPQAEYHGVIDGRRFITCSVHYENITIRDDEGKLYYLPPETLLIALNEFLFMVEKKRTRTWLKPLVSDKVEESNDDYEAYKMKRQLDEETDISEQRMREINRLRKIVTNFYAPKYYVVIVRGDVEPELSVKSNTEDERDSLAKQIKRDDSNQEDGIYWLNIVNGLPEIGSYSGAFFDDDNEVGDPKAPYYTKNRIKNKWVCVFRTQYGWDCVRYNGGEHDGMPYLYDSKEAVEADQFFDKATDFAHRADMFKRGRNLIFDESVYLTAENKCIAREQQSDFNETDSSDEGGCFFWMLVGACVIIGLIIYLVVK